MKKHVLGPNVPAKLLSSLQPHKHTHSSKIPQLQTVTRSFRSDLLLFLWDPSPAAPIFSVLTLTLYPIVPATQQDFPQTTTNRQIEMPTLGRDVRGPSPKTLYSDFPKVLHQVSLSSLKHNYVPPSPHLTAAPLHAS